ncbi:MAG: ATP-binding protein [Methanoregula sp.]|nr:ATP-binding protein [Methanoregula sp.]
MQSPSFSCTIPADIREIPALSDRLESAMKNGGFSDNDILDTQLAVEETVTNIIVHGYGDAVGEITIACRVGPDEIAIQLEDHAVPFDPLSLPEPDLHADIDDRQIGGLGIFLTRKIMQEIRYRFEDGKNILTLVKKKSG